MQYRSEVGARSR